MVGEDCQRKVGDFFVKLSLLGKIKFWMLTMKSPLRKLSMDIISTKLHVFQLAPTQR